MPKAQGLISAHPPLLRCQYQLRRRAGFVVTLPSKGVPLLFKFSLFRSQESPHHPERAVRVVRNLRRRLRSPRALRRGRHPLVQRLFRPVQTFVGNVARDTFETTGAEKVGGRTPQEGSPDSGSRRCPPIRSGQQTQNRVSSSLGPHREMVPFVPAPASGDRVQADGAPAQSLRGRSGGAEGSRPGP